MILIVDQKKKTRQCANGEKTVCDRTNINVCGIPAHKRLLNINRTVVILYFGKCARANILYKCYARRCMSDVGLTLPYIESDHQNLKKKTIYSVEFGEKERKKN